MILTNCACCAAPLPHLAKQCSRCKTRYCGPACQAQHWKEGGHDKCCKKIKRGGGAEQHHSDKKYSEAVKVAAETYAKDTKGQTCYICTEALHRRTKEGLVRGCACHTTEGFVHVSCLAEQAKFLVAEAFENNLDIKVQCERWDRWHNCSLCEQDYHDVVKCALGWACWKTYVGLPEEAIQTGSNYAFNDRVHAMTVLGNGLSEAHLPSEWLNVLEAQLATAKRIGMSLGGMSLDLDQIYGNLSNCYADLGRREDSLRLDREIYALGKRSRGFDAGTLSSANNLIFSLGKPEHTEERTAIFSEVLPHARALGAENTNLSLRLRAAYAKDLIGTESRDLIEEAVAEYEDMYRISKRVFGPSHPDSQARLRGIEWAREKLARARLA